VTSLPRVVFITGASAGIGAALAERFAAPGQRLGLVARRAERLAHVAARCRDRGAEVVTYPVDVSDLQAITAAASDFSARCGEVDVVIANAGVSRRESDPREWGHALSEVMAVNLLGVVHTLAPFVEAMEARGRGSLVAISSVAGFRGIPDAGAYCASKAAVNAWMESLRVRLSGRVHVMTVCPGFIATDMTASNRFRMPWLRSAEYAAERITRGVRRETSTLVFPWQMAWLMRVVRLLPPSIYDRLMAYGRARGMTRKAPPVLHETDPRRGGIAAP